MIDENFTPFGEGLNLVMSPLTGAKTCLETEENGIKSWLCLSSGYASNSNQTFDSNGRALIIKSSPKIVVDLEIEDNDGLYWYPAIVNYEHRGVLYPAVKDGKFCWAYSPRIEIENDDVFHGNIDREKYEILAEKQTKYFSDTEFYLGLKELGAILNFGE